MYKSFPKGCIPQLLDTNNNWGVFFYIKMSYVYLVNHFDIIYNKRENEICFSECVRAY